MPSSRFLSVGVLAASALSLALLAACGGGGSGTSATASSSTDRATASSVQLSTYITDDLTTDYSQVWVGIKSITATDRNGDTVTLFTSDDASGYSTYDLRSLASVGELMSAVSVNSGVYTSIQVTMASAVSLVLASDGSTVAAHFTSDGTDKVVRVGVSLDTTTSTALVLDFNLAHFTYNATTGLVTPEVTHKNSSSLKQFKVHQGTVRGTVTGVDATANTLTVNDSRLGTATVLTLASDAVISRESDGTTLTLSDLTTGMTVEARGVITSTATDGTVTVQVSTVQVKDSSSSTVPGTVYRGEGTVQSIDGSTVTLLLSEASFLPASATVVLDVSTTKYQHGQSSDLVAGAKLSFRASYDSTTEIYTASSLDIEGTASETERKRRGTSNVANRASKLDGTVTAISGTTWTVLATETHGSVTAGQTYTVDVSGAMVKAATGCIVVGSAIETRGALSGTSLTARVVRLESECSATQSTTT